MQKNQFLLKRILTHISKDQKKKDFIYTTDKMSLITEVSTMTSKPIDGLNTWNDIQRTKQLKTQNLMMGNDIEEGKSVLSEQTNRYIQVKEDDFALLRETLEKVMRRNTLLEGKIEALVEESNRFAYSKEERLEEPIFDQDTPKDGTQEEKIERLEPGKPYDLKIISRKNIERSRFIDLQKQLAINIAECKAEYDAKELELIQIRSQIDIRVKSQNMSKNILEMIENRIHGTINRTFGNQEELNILRELENRVHGTRTKKHKNQEEFFVENIKGLSVLLAECKGEIDRKNLEIGNLKAELAVKCEGKISQIENVGNRKKKINRLIRLLQRASKSIF